MEDCVKSDSGRIALPSIVQPPGEQTEIVPFEVTMVKLEERYPILDKTLFIGREFNEVILGGKNASHLQVAARSKKGESVGIKLSSDSSYLSTDLWKMPYLEFSYRVTFFAVEVEIDRLTPVCHLRRISKPTMSLLPMEAYAN